MAKQSAQPLFDRILDAACVVSGENDWVHVFTIRNGKISAFRGHQDTGLLAQAYHGAPASKRAANT